MERLVTTKKSNTNICLFEKSNYFNYQQKLVYGEGI